MKQCLWRQTLLSHAVRSTRQPITCRNTLRSQPISCLLHLAASSQPITHLHLPQRSKPPVHFYSSCALVGHLKQGSASFYCIRRFLPWIIWRSLFRRLLQLVMFLWHFFAKSIFVIYYNADTWITVVLTATKGNGRVTWLHGVVWRLN